MSERTRQLRILTYNIRHAQGMDGRIDIERTAGVIKALAPDVVSLQELDRGQARTAGMDQPNDTPQSRRFKPCGRPGPMPRRDSSS